MALIFILSFIGLRLAGFYGLLLGAMLGYFISRSTRVAARKGLHEIQSQFVESTFAVLGAICKADGVVSREEIQATEQLIARFRLSSEQSSVAKAAFNRGKSPDFDLDAEVDKFATAAHSNRVMYQMFLRVQMMAIAADGIVHPAEQALLVRVARRLGYSEQEIAQLEILFRAGTAGAPGEAGRPRTQASLDDAYVVLGLSREASEKEIKRAYRKLMLEHHPDKVAAKGLPSSMLELAEERAREINVAYDVIKKARGLA